MCQINAFNLFVYAEAIVEIVYVLFYAKTIFHIPSNVNKQMRKKHNY